MKKRLSLFLATTLMVQSSFSFSDLTPTHWAYNNVMAMQEKGIVSGFDDDTFKPDMSLTREQFITMLANVWDFSWKSKCQFNDSTNRWSTEYIETAGYCLVDDGETMFIPEGLAIREDVAMALVKALELEDYFSDQYLQEKFSDIKDISDDRMRYVAIAVELGLMNGSPDGKFNPKLPLTRAEGASVINNLLHKIPVTVIQKDNKYGVIDNINGITIVPFIYDYAQLFYGGVIGVVKDGKIGAINYDGNTIFDCGKYDDLEPSAGYFEKGIIIVEKNNKYGVITLEGKQILPCEYEELAFGTALSLSNSNQVAIINLRKKTAQIYDEYMHYYDFKVAQKLDKRIIINAEGNEIFSLNPSDILGDILLDNLICIGKNGKYGVINEKGEEIVPYVYDQIIESVEHLMIVEKDGMYGFIDKYGNELIPCIYEYTSDFTQEVTIVRKNNLYGVIDKTGKVVTPCIYNHISDFSQEGLAIVSKDNLYGLIDKTGELIIPCTYDLELFNVTVRELFDNINN